MDESIMAVFSYQCQLKLVLCLAVANATTIIVVGVVLFATHSAQWGETRLSAKTGGLELQVDDARLNRTVVRYYIHNGTEEGGNIAELYTHMEGGTEIAELSNASQPTDDTVATAITTDNGGKACEPNCSSTFQLQSSLQLQQKPSEQVNRLQTEPVMRSVLPITQCRESNCMEYLSTAEKLAIKACQREVTRKGIPVSSIKKANCNFMDKKGRAPVALVSAEGCGNTWVRALLEQATGICTGFVWCDFKMRQYGFIGEAVKSDSVLVVKTHSGKPHWLGQPSPPRPSPEPFYGSAVFVVRNPHDSLIAEWNRRATNQFLIKKNLPHNESHTNIVPKELFRELFQKGNYARKIKTIHPFSYGYFFSNQMKTA